MYLKEIEILGFKSFADKATFTLDNDITCVVGPNGSGKSNIVDAIRWVFGEQSTKKLRGEDEMADLIFSGSKSRNALNSCYVSLTFDNSDNYLNLPYTEVTIKRRLYRTGENEYFINGEKVRLKDITELLLDTGIGKSSFSIISQGEIGKILSASSVDRRSIIEEAAGILKYKTRRDEALKKLDKTVDNINHTNDIINELELRVNPLKEQATKAKEYLDIHSKLQEIEVALLQEEITEFNSKLLENKNNIEKYNNDILILQNKIANSKLEESKINEVELNKRIESKNTELITLTKRLGDLDSKRKLLKERSKYDANDLRVHENLVNLREQEFNIKNDITLINADIDNYNNSLNVTKNSLNNLIELYNNSKIKKDNLFKEYNFKNREFLENKNHINVIKDSLENNNTINSNSKKILNNPRLTGVYDAFGNILNTDNKYSKALEVCISGTKNNLIVDNPDTAKMCIEYLKTNKLGRCTFYPINVIKPKGIDLETIDTLELSPDYLGVLSDFVKYDNKYRNIVLNQLGNIVLVTDIDAANMIAKTINNSYKIVTLDGDVVNIGGSITGGSVNSSITPISLKNELSDLVIKNNSLSTVLDEFDNSIKKEESNIKELEEKIYLERGNLTNLKELINTNNDLLTNKEKELDDIQTELSNLTSTDLSEEENNLNNEYYACKEEKDLLEKNISNLKKDHDILKATILELEGLEKVDNNNLRDLERNLDNLNNANEKLENNIDNNLNILSEDYSLTYEKAHEEYILDMNSIEARQKVNEYKSKIKKMGFINVDAIKEYEEANTRYEFLTNQRNDLLSAKDILYNIINEMDDVMTKDFNKTFDELKVEFKEVFKKLFKGGEANIILTDPDNILETGVDIEACPPGKNLKNINALSGGEKTLTAISLLFAILNIRKIPFCVFDEVEAALDEANVDIFGHYLDNYKDKTQFLLITHKKRTMEYAKNLYGITMQESGVSKLVSVNLK